MRSRCVAIMLWVLLLVVSMGCKQRPKDVLSREQLITVLTELYLTEGSFEAMYIRTEQKKLAYYNSLFTKHGITREQLERSVAYYAAQDSRELEQIYDAVLDSLRAKQVLVRSHYYHPVVEESEVQIDTLNLWTHPSRVVWHPDSVCRADSLTLYLGDSLYFASGDRFVLRFLQSTNNCDSIFGGYVSLMAYYSGGERDSVEAMLLPDARVRRYTLSINNVDSLRPIALRAQLLCYDSLAGVADRWFDSIALLRIYDAKRYPLPDSLRQVLQKDKADDAGALVNKQTDMEIRKVKFRPIKLKTQE